MPATNNTKVDDLIDVSDVLNDTLISEQDWKHLASKRFGAFFRGMEKNRLHRDGCLNMVMEMLGIDHFYHGSRWRRRVRRL